jgi:hypothetical protein
LAAVVLVGAIGTSAMAQQRGKGFDPAQMRQRMMDNIKEQLGASDDEWKVLQPKVEKVMDAQRDARSGGFGFGFGTRGRGGPPGGGDNNSSRTRTTSDSPVARAQQELQKTLENKDASPDDIKSKLAALRDARTQAHENLTKSQAELKDLLTQRQEATMVMMGMLE